MTEDEPDTASPGSVNRVAITAAGRRACQTLSRAEVREIVDQTIEEISQALVRGEAVELRGFGTFKVRKKPERIGRNPRSGVEAVITSRRVVTFKPSPALVAKVNGWPGVRLKKATQDNTPAPKNVRQKEKPGTGPGEFSR